MHGASETEDTTEFATLKLQSTLGRESQISVTGKVESLAEVDVESNVYLKGLRNHMVKTLDYQVAQAFRSSDVMFIPTSPTAGTWDVDGTASTTALSNITAVHVKDIIDGMKVGAFGANSARPIPYYDGESYVCLTSVKFLRGLKDDPDCSHSPLAA